MADSLLDNYNPLYDIHLRQYFALPHMQKHLQKMGLLESTLNLNGDEVYARHHAMMDMMLKNREAQLLKMAELRKKLDAAEKVECCRRIRTGQSPESYRQGKPSRSLSRNRAGQKSNSGGRQRRYSNSYEDRDFVQRIEERNSDPVEQNTRDPYKRLSANAKRFNYLHKLDDNTLIAYKDNLRKQLQRLERFREISFGPHSVARQPPPPQASWFFRRRSVLNMRGRKATTGNKLNASHDSRTSCPPTTRKRKDSNTRLPPINPQKSRVPTKPPMPVSLQQITTKLPPAAKKPAPTRGRPSNKRQTTTTTTTITSVSKSPTKIENTNTTTLPALPSVTGHGIFTGAAAAATVAAIGTAAINMDSLIDDEQQKEPSPPNSPLLETQKTFDKSSPTEEQLPGDILENLADESENLPEPVAEHDEHEIDDHIAREIVLDNAPVDHSHGDYEDSESEPEYAEEDRESPVEDQFVRQEVGQTAASPVAQLEVETHLGEAEVSPPVSDVAQESPKELSYQSSPGLPSQEEASEVPERVARSPPTLIFTEQSTEEDTTEDHMESPVQSPQSPVVSIDNMHTQVVEHFETHDALPQSPVHSVHEGHDEEQEERRSIASPVHSTQHESHEDLEGRRPSDVADDDKHLEENVVAAPASPVESHTSEPRGHSPDSQSIQHVDLTGSHPHSPVQSESGARVARSASNQSDQHEQGEAEFDVPPADQTVQMSPAHDSHSSDLQGMPQSPVASEHEFQHQEHAPASPVTHAHSVLSDDAEADQPEAAGSPVQRALSIDHSYSAEEQEVAQAPSPPSSVHDGEMIQSGAAEESNIFRSQEISMHDSHHSDQQEHSSAPASPVVTVDVSEQLERSQSDVPPSPVASVHSEHEPENHVTDLKEEAAFHEQEQEDHEEPAPAPVSEHFETQSPISDHHEKSAPASPVEHHRFSDAPVQIEIHEEERHDSPTLATSDDYKQKEHHSSAPQSPVAVPQTIEEHRSKSPDAPAHDSPILTKEAEDQEESFELHHHQSLSRPAPESPTAMDLYNPSHGNMESPVLSDSESHAPETHHVQEETESPTAAAVIADRIDLEAYHNSPTKESTSPVVVNPVDHAHFTHEDVVDQLQSPQHPEESNSNYEDIINKSADEEASNLIQEALTEAPAIIDMVNTYEEKDKFSPRESHEEAMNNDMTTSIYQPHSENEEEEDQIDHGKFVTEPEIVTKEWDEDNHHVKESTTHSEYSEGNTHMSVDEKVTIITENDHQDKSQDSPRADNISTDSLIIHDDPQISENQMTQSIYQPHDETEEKHWDEGNKHVHEVTHNSEFTDEAGKHYHETVTTTTTVIKSGDDMKNNNDDVGDEDGESDTDNHQKEIEDHEGMSPNGNLLRETVTTTTHTVTSGGLPKSGILVDDGDETNISSL